LLEEFVAHTSNVNCLKVGRKTSRILLTGGEDQKVNLWAIGKPNAILVLQSPTKFYYSMQQLLNGSGLNLFLQVDPEEMFEMQIGSI